MIVPAFLTIGTPGGQWPSWLSSLLNSQPEGADDWPTTQPALLQALRASQANPRGPGPADAAGDVASMDTLAQRLPDAQVLVLVERPSLGLAAALAAGLVDDPAPWLHDWCEGARRLLWRAQSDPLRCLLVDAEEAWQHPEALAASVNQRFGLDVAATQAATEWAAVDPLSRALAEAIAAAHPEAQALFAELQASCVLLAPEPPVADFASAGPPIDGLSAVGCLQALRVRLLAAEDEAERRADELVALRAQAQAQHASLQAVSVQLAQSQRSAQRAAADLAAAAGQNQLLQQQLAERSETLAQLNQAHQAQAQALQAAVAERAGRQRELGELRQESELLLQQLHQVQGELESVFLARREAELRLAETSAERDSQVRLAADQAQQMAQQAQALQQLAQQLQEAQAGLKTLQAEAQRNAQQRDQSARVAQDAQAAQQASDQRGQEKAAALSSLQLELAAERRTAVGTRQENELMLQQLHQVQGELEHYYVECRRLEAAAASMVPATAGLNMAVAEVLPLAERDTPPHRELTFQLRGVTLEDREIPEATVRLVEHQGHPGLVVFGNEAGAQLLTCWQETGREDGRPFMLLVPADAPVRPLLEAMDQADWLLLQSLPARLEQALDEQDPPLAPHWQQLARRLQAQLQAPGRRLRYREVDVAPVPDGPPGAWACQFSQLLWGSYRLPKLTAHWQTSGPLAGITLLNDAEAGPPLTSWPADERGLPLSRWHLPLGPGAAKRDKRHAWAQLAAPDREFLLALLAIWPQALAQAAAGPLPDAGTLAPAASALLQDALRATRRAGGWLGTRRAPGEPRRT